MTRCSGWDGALLKTVSFSKTSYVAGRAAAQKALSRRASGSALVSDWAFAVQAVSGRTAVQKTSSHRASGSRPVSDWASAVQAVSGRTAVQKASSHRASGSRPVSDWAFAVQAVSGRTAASSSRMTSAVARTFSGLVFPGRSGLFAVPRPWAYCYVHLALA